MGAWLPLLFLLGLPGPASAAAARFDPPLEKFEADYEQEAARLREALAAFLAGADCYGEAGDLEETAARRRTEASALHRLHANLNTKLGTYRASLEGLEIRNAAETLNGRAAPEMLLARFAAQRRTVDRMEMEWRSLGGRIDKAASDDAAAAAEALRRRKEVERRRRLVVGAGGVAAGLATVLLAFAAKRPRRRAPPPQQRPDPRNRRGGPARLQ